MMERVREPAIFAVPDRISQILQRRFEEQERLFLSI
jgi:hypothetical protein